MIDNTFFLKRIRELEEDLRRAREHTDFMVRENIELRRKLREKGHPIARYNPDDYDY